MDVTFFQDDAAVIARQAEIPAANFANGMNLSGSNAGGIGINQGGGAISGSTAEFTLLDQHGNPRTAQISQSLGGYPYTDPATYPSSDGTEGTLPDAVIQFGTPNVDGSVNALGNSTLNSLAEGWTDEF